MRSTRTIVFGASCNNCIGASCQNCNRVRAGRADGSVSELCVDNDFFLTTTGERFVLHMNPSVLIYITV